MGLTDREQDKSRQMWRQCRTGRWWEGKCFAKLCGNMFNVLYLCYHYQHTHTKLASKEINTIQTKDSPGCWQMAVVHGSVTHTYLVIAFHLKSLYPLFLNAEWKLAHSENSLPFTFKSGCTRHLVHAQKHWSQDWDQVCFHPSRLSVLIFVLFFV